MYETDQKRNPNSESSCRKNATIGLFCAVTGADRSTPAAAVVAVELVELDVVDDVVRLVVGLEVVVLVPDVVVLVVDVLVPVVDQSSLSSS